MPKYIQVAEVLIRDIAAGRLIDGERLKPERDMAVDLNISVGTLRKALVNLEQKGLLRRIQGSGNYISGDGDLDSVYAMFRLELPKGGGLPSAVNLGVSLMEKPHDLPTFGTATQATRIRRLRKLNETIVALEEIWLDRSVGEVNSEALSDSLYHYYKTELGFWITRAEDRVSFANVPQWTPENFPLPRQATAGYVERFSWSDAPAPIEFSRTWFDISRAQYVQRLK